jgi:antibiotic biosynthesis monooxygenase (ABM) superfamily enzyme
VSEQLIETFVLRHPLRSGQQERYQQLANALLAQAQQAQGFLDSDHQLPPPDGNQHRISLTFISANHLQAWLHSYPCQQLLAQIQPLLEGDEPQPQGASPHQRAWHAAPNPFMRFNLMQRPWWQRLAISVGLLALFIALLPLLLLALAFLLVAGLVLRHKFSRIMSRPFRGFGQ